MSQILIVDHGVLISFTPHKICNKYSSTQLSGNISKEVKHLLQDSIYLKIIKYMSIKN